MKINNEPIVAKPMLKAELESMMSAVEHECNVYALEDSEGEAPMDRIAKIDGKKSDRALRFRDELLNMRDRFQRIFMTEKGSTYFLLESGECFRIKRRDISNMQSVFEHPDLEYVVRPIFNDVRFISKKEMERVLQKGTERYGVFVFNDLEGSEIELSKLQIGSHPIEFYDPVGNFVDSTRGDFERLMVSRDVVQSYAHPGDKIVQIVK